MEYGEWLDVLYSQLDVTLMPLLHFSELILDRFPFASHLIHHRYHRHRQMTEILSNIDQPFL